MNTPFSASRTALLLTCIFSSSWMSASTVALAFKTPWAEYKLTFDPTVISVDEIKTLARVSPYDFYADSIPDLEFCAVKSCNFGLRDGWRAPNYYQNAEMNVVEAKEQLRFLYRLTYPETLRPWISFLQRTWSFHVWLEEIRLEFYKSWNIETLKRPYHDLDPATTCPEALQAISAAAGDHDTQFVLAKFQWNTCLAEKYQPEIGQYPTEPWKRFLRDYHIKEDVKLPESSED